MPEGTSEATSKKTYRFIYKDSSYLDYDLGAVDAYKAMQAVVEGQRAVMTEIGALVVDDIRSIVEARDPEPIPSNGEVPADLPPEWQQWIKAQAEYEKQMKEKEDDDVDY